MSEEKKRAAMVAPFELDGLSLCGECVIIPENINPEPDDLGWYLIEMCPECLAVNKGIWEEENGGRT